MCFHIDAVCSSHIGKVRSNNEDNFLFDGRCMRLEDNREARSLSCSVQTNRYSCFAVFDGMGGGEDGGSAAYIAAKTLMTAKPSNKNPQQFLIDTCKAMNKAVCLESIRIGNHRMGTTTVILFLYLDKLYLSNIGDSRAYLIRNRKISQLSCDHVFRLPEGVSIKSHGSALSQYLGVFEEEVIVQPSFSEETCLPGDILLLCTDGITDMISDRDILESVNMTDSAAVCAEELMCKALANGGKDNITLIVARIGERI